MQTAARNLVDFLVAQSARTVPPNLMGEFVKMGGLNHCAQLGTWHAGLDKHSCTATAQLVAYYLTGNVRTLPEIMMAGVALHQWEVSSVWLETVPQLLTFDLQAHKFSVVVLPQSSNAVLIQSNQFPGPQYTMEEWLHQRGPAAMLNSDGWFVMTRKQFDIFLQKLLLARTENDMVQLFGVKYRINIQQALVARNVITAFAEQK